MNAVQSRKSGQKVNDGMMLRRISRVAGILLLGILTTTANAQDVRYSWLDMSFMAQDVGDITGTQMAAGGDTVDITGTDGNGIRFRGSFGTWYNMYMFVEFGSTDIDVFAVVSNAQGQFPATDEFDLTTIRGGLGFKYNILSATDLYIEASAESVDLDFGSFSGENFDTDDQDFGGTIGVRSMLNDDIEVRGYARYTNLGDVILNGGAFDADTLFGVGVGWQVVRGFSLVADYENGEFSNWSIGFRLDLDEN